MGHSQGGWAALAAAGVKMEGVLGAVNLSGGTNYRRMGIGLITPEVQKHWIQASGVLGKSALVPVLWLYAENDRNHPPNYVKQMFAAFQQAGAKAN
jgi:pimeloyl-ACP methyl ester carboxylesterase